MAMFDIDACRVFPFQKESYSQMEVVRNFPFGQADSAYRNSFGYAKSDMSGEDIRDLAIKVPGGYAQPKQFHTIHRLPDSRRLQR